MPAVSSCCSRRRRPSPRWPSAHCCPAAAVPVSTYGRPLHCSCVTLTASAASPASCSLNDACRACVYRWIACSSTGGAGGAHTRRQRRVAWAAGHACVQLRLTSSVPNMLSHDAPADAGTWVRMRKGADVLTAIGPVVLPAAGGAACTAGAAALSAGECAAACFFLLLTPVSRQHRGTGARSNEHAACMQRYALVLPARMRSSHPRRRPRRCPRPM